MLRRLGIRGKILAVVAVPIIVLLIAAAFVTVNATAALSAANNSRQLIETVADSKPFLAAFRAERDAATNFLDSWSDAEAKVSASQSAADDAVTALVDSGSSVTDDVYAILDGGAEGASMSLADARAVEPTPDEESGWWAWPSSDVVTEVSSSIDAMATAVDELADSAPASAQASLADLRFALEQEAQRREVLLTAPIPYQEAMIEAIPASNATWSALNTEIDNIADIDANAAAKGTLEGAAGLMATIDTTRADVAARRASDSTANALYTAVTASINDSIGLANLAMDDPDVTLELAAYGELDNLFEQLWKERFRNQSIIRAGQYAPGEATAARSQIAATDFARDDSQSAVELLGSELVVPDWGASQSPTSNQDFESVRNAVGIGDNAQLVTLQGLDWVGMVEAEAAAQEPAYDSTLARAITLADEVRQAALFQTLVTAVLAVLVVIASLVIALLISRRIVVPLRRLTTTANAVRTELPRLVERVAMPGETVDVAEVQIPVESSDEVGRLAEAFNSVNATTLSIASEQAALRGSISEMFVNVARRDQVLLNRQLASIDDMERTQDDPETLTKLFALDHLATRMRRNSESLLVLAGIDTGRRLRRSMPLSDVIRTASSEIELYERVKLELDADPAMLGHSALTAAHLFAELLENATVFSDPGSPVVVRTVEVDGNFVVEVQDSGIGMTAAELAEANSRVASTAASEILGAQRLGLFVVGRIARRIGARVVIESTEGQGTKAIVTMTPSLFDSTYASEVPHHTESTVDEAMHAPAALVSHSASEEQFDAAPPSAAAAAVGAYQPAVVESAPLVARAAAEEPSLDDLIAADAANAPEGAAVDTGELTDGTSATGLPTRRRREASVEVSAEEQQKIIGLPARATAAQLSALEAESSVDEFTPAVPASEIAPQTPESRAQMFRGFRSRKELSEAAPMADPEAESLGHAARRGGLAAEEVVAAQQSDAFVVPALEDDEDDAQGSGVGGAAAIGGAALAGAAIAGAATPSLEDDEPEVAAPASDEPEEMVIPLLEEDDEYPVAATAAPSDVVPELEADDEVVAEPSATDLAAAEPEADAAPSLEATDAPEAIAPALDTVDAAKPSAPAVPSSPEATPAAPFSYADVYGSLPAQPVQPTTEPSWGVESVALSDEGGTPEPTIDELIAGASGEEAGRSGFFARLFGRSKKSKAPAAEAAIVATAAAAAPRAQEPAQAPVVDQAPVAEQAPAPTNEFAPTADFDHLTAPVDEPTPAEPEYMNVVEQPTLPPLPEEDEALAGQVPTAFEPAPEPSVADVVEAPAVAASEPEAVPQPGGAFALWTSKPHAQEPWPAQEAAPVHEATPAEPAPVQESPVAASETPAPGQAFTPDELANPFGWEAAGASALAATTPDAATSYQPFVDINPEELADGSGSGDITSDVFSELSSLASVRPTVDKTRAGLQRRRSVDAPAPEVKPIEPEVQLAHKERDADEVRNRFSNFYSGTQRARSDVAEFEQRSQSTASKE